MADKITEKPQFVCEVTVIDPDSHGEVEVSIYKTSGGGMFGIDSSWLLYQVEQDTPLVFQSPFDEHVLLDLEDLEDEGDYEYENDDFLTPAGCLSIEYNDEDPATIALERMEVESMEHEGIGGMFGEDE